MIPYLLVEGAFNTTYEKNTKRAHFGLRDTVIVDKERTNWYVECAIESCKLREIK